MTRSLTSIKTTVRISATLQNTLNDGAVVPATQPNLNYNPALRNGVGPSQADRSWQGSGTLTEDATITLDLANMANTDIGCGNGYDAVGQAVDYENILSIAIHNNNAVGDAGSLEVYPSIDWGWTPIGIHKVSTGGALRGQGILLKTQPDEGGFDISTTAPKSRQITLHAVGASVDWAVYIIARSADQDTSSSSSSQSNSSSSSSSQSTSSSSQSLSESSQSTSSSSQSSSSSSSSSKSTSSSSSSQSSSSLSSTS